MTAFIAQIKRLSIIEVISHLAFWWFMIFVAISADIDTDMSFPAHIFTQGLIYGMPLNMLVFYLNFFYLVPKFLAQHTRWYFAGVVVLVVLTSIFEGLLDVGYLYLLGTPAKIPSELFALILLHMLIHSCYWFMSLPMKLGRDWFGNYRQQKEIKAQQSKTELALLKSQVHPHFLFNTLNTLYSSSYEYGDTQTALGIGKLSHLLRYMLYETQDEKVSLSNEIDYLQDYIDLQKMRFADDVTVNFHIKGEPGEVTVAPMLFITLVENAFKHGVSPARHGQIDIELEIENANQHQSIRLKVENDILRESRSTSQKHLEGDSGGLGLENLQKRLSLIYPDHHLLKITQQNNRYITQLELS